MIHPSFSPEKEKSKITDFKYYESKKNLYGPQPITKSDDIVNKMRILSTSKEFREPFSNIYRSYKNPDIDI